MYSNVLVSPPAIEPVTLAQAKAHLRLEEKMTKDDAYIASLIGAARSKFEEFTGRAVIYQDWKLTLDGFPGLPRADDWWDGVREGPVSMFNGSGPIELIRAPVYQVNSITTYDADDVPTVMNASGYRLNNGAQRVTVKQGTSWPTNLRDSDGVEVEYRCGYASSGIGVPNSIRQAIMIIVAHWYENREIILQGNAAVTMLVGEVPMTATNLMQQYKVMRL